MLPGIYGVTFNVRGQVGQGGVVLQNLKINGFDNHYLYRGNYTDDNGKATATIEVKNFSGQFASVFGAYDILHLTLAGSSNPAGFTLTGTAQEVPNLTITITGKKLGDLAR